MELPSYAKWLIGITDALVAFSVVWIPLVILAGVWMFRRNREP